MSKNIKQISAALLLVASSMSAPALPQVYSMSPEPVEQTHTGWVESAPAISTSNVGQQIAILNNSMDNINQMDFPGQIQLMDEKIQSLQGKVDELQHQVDVLSSQQRQQYLDLDARISQKSAAPTTVSTAALSASSGTPAQRDKQTYQAAYHLITEKKYDQAIVAFNGYLDSYHEQGQYSANAYYWLGELYDLKKNYTQATSSLETVVSQFPSSGKVADALYKLGMLAQAQGDSTQATNYFQQVIHDYPASTSAKLAKEHL